MANIITGNYGLNNMCPLCKERKDTTEHIFECTNVEGHGLTTQNLKEGTCMDKILELYRTIESERRDMLVDSIITHFNIIQREEIKL